MKQEILDKLKSDAIALIKLLDDPQPGLSTWIIATCERWKAIADAWE